MFNLIDIIIFILIIIVVIILNNLNKLNHRIQNLEKTVNNFLLKRKTTTEQPSFQSQIESQETFKTQIDAEQTSIGVITPPETSLSYRFTNWLKENWLLKLGALLLLIGFGWFVTYAFLHNWIGPIGRITLGLIVGTLFLLFGWFRMQNYLTQGSIFLVLGSTIILLTIFAARFIYDFFTPLSSLIVMFLTNSFVAFVSVKYKIRPLAILSLLLASIVPLLTNSPQINPNYIRLFSYLFIITLGAIWIVILTGYRELTFIALIIVSAYSLSHFFNPHLTDIKTLLLFAYAFSSLFFWLIQQIFIN
ncbi:MAG: hypothetical protein KatS3mg094_153 [Candidatus Parcubacteria bacterium]|nr:MAG: hypothetical protein KatS3mg094_153 [Candidatus Parcubacteria bacterium]